MNKPLVSISCITYNHSKFIKECLDGFLMQQANFDFEVLIHDDASTDNTQEIIKAYQEKHPSIIKPILQTENQYSKGVRGINAKFNYSRAQGKYIALCEGDDYWTDPLKLQKQVDFLEANPLYAGSATNSIMIFEDSSKNKLFKKSTVNLDLYIEDLLGHRHFHTASFLFKKECIINVDFPKILSGDRYLFLLITSNGPIHYINKSTCVYRKNDGGISRKVTSNDMILDVNFIKASNQFLNKKQTNQLKIFIYKTVFNYSHKIYLKHYIYFSFKLFVITKFKKSTLFFIKSKLSKVQL